MSCICIITALPAESRVFIDALKLRHLNDHGWRLFGKEQFLLLQTGMGKLKAAAATSAVLHTRPDICAVINVGVVGAMQPLGTVLMAHQIVDTASGAKWYPHLPPQRSVDHLPTASVRTLDKPSNDYQTDTLFDMEAAGIISAATTYLSTDAIQSIKVVSDNPSAPLQAVDPAKATQLMQASVTSVLKLADWYLDAANHSDQTLELDALSDAIIRQIHHTTHEGHQLRRLMHQFCSLTGTPADAIELINMGTAKTIRRHLQTRISNTPLHYGNDS